MHGHEWLLPVEDSIQDSIYIEDLGLELVSDEIDKTRFGIITKSNLASWRETAALSGSIDALLDGREIDD